MDEYLTNFNAEMARSISEGSSSISLYATLVKINQSANLGVTFVNIYKQLSKESIFKLTERGFKVKDNPINHAKHLIEW